MHLRHCIHLRCHVRGSDVGFASLTCATLFPSSRSRNSTGSVESARTDCTTHACSWNLRHAVAKLQVPKFYWFSGIGLNRLHNPCMQLARTLPNLRVMTITLHPAGLTNHRWAEREMLEMERTNLEGSKERILLPLGEVPTAQPMHAVGPYTR